MGLWKKMSLTVKYMLLSLGVLFFGFALLGAIIIKFIYSFEPLFNYIMGLLLGCVVTAIRLIIMDRSIDKTVDMPDKKAKVHYHLMFFLRYGILVLFAVVLVVFHTVFGVCGGVIGVLCMQLSAYGANYLLTKHEKKTGKKIPAQSTDARVPKYDIELVEFEDIETSHTQPFDVMTAPIEKRQENPEKNQNK